MLTTVFVGESYEDLGQQQKRPRTDICFNYWNEKKMIIRQGLLAGMSDVCKFCH